MEFFVSQRKELKTSLLISDGISYITNVAVKVLNFQSAMIFCYAFQKKKKNTETFFFHTFKEDHRM